MLSFFYHGAQVFQAVILRVLLMTEVERFSNGFIVNA
jgi:hypothetical protein